MRSTNIFLKSTNKLKAYANKNPPSNVRGPS